MPGGRPRLSRAIFSFHDESWPPEEVVVDTSFVVSALFTAEDYHAECLNALLDLASKDVRIFFSTHVYVEMIEVGYRSTLRERYGKGWTKRRPDGRARRRAGRIAGKAVDNWRGLSNALRTTCVDAGQVTDFVPDIMRLWGLQSYDAVHAATAIREGVNSMVAVDRDFASVPATRLTIYTVHDLVSDMRRRRARRRR